MSETLKSNPPLGDEYQAIETLFERLDKEDKCPFPVAGEPLDAPQTQGVYVIRDFEERVIHVGRTYRGRGGLKQRLNDHLRGQSSFVRDGLKGDRRRLRGGYTFQCLPVEDNRRRALLEYFATARHCPKHLGVGAVRPKPANANS